MSDKAIVVKDLQKSYGDLKVLRGINFTVRRGSVLALLGPNGAGKTTTIRILSTLLKADGGKAAVNGHDVEKEEAAAKASIGLTGQYAAVDGYLTGEENLYLIGRLYRMSRDDTRRRTEELLKQFDLVKPGKRPVKTYSGGMRRRLDLAMSLIAAPPIIFLDEPTTGLDPRSRLSMWAMIKQLVEGGTTVLLTTQYMDEADHLADDIVVIDNGKVIAEGTPNQLKAKIGSDRLELTLAEGSDLEKAKKVVDGKKVQVDAERRVISVATKGGVKDMRQMLQKLEESKIKVESVELRRPTLDDVFLTLTGHSATEAEKTAKKSKKKRGKK